MGSYADYYGIKLPSQSQVQSGVQFGWAGTEFVGSLTGSGGTYTAAANVRAGTNRGDGVLGTLAVPAANQVLSGVAVDATTGNVVLPSVSAVRLGTAFGPNSSSVGTSVAPIQSDVRAGVGYGANGTEFVGSFVAGGAGYTAASNVRFGTDRGDGTIGTLRVPQASQVLLGVAVDATTGNVRLPTTSQVQSGVAYGASDALVGTLTGGSVSITVLPLSATVQNRVDGTTINLFYGEVISVAIAITDAAGQAVNLAGRTLAIVIEGRTRIDRAVIDNANIARTGNTITFMSPAGIVSKVGQRKWSLRDVTSGSGEGVVLAHGTLNVNYCPADDA